MNKGLKITLWAVAIAAVGVGCYFGYKKFFKNSDISDNSSDSLGNNAPMANTKGMTGSQILEAAKTQNVDLSKLTLQQQDELRKLGLPVRGGATLVAGYDLSKHQATAKIVSGRG